MKLIALRILYLNLITIIQCLGQKYENPYFIIPDAKDLVGQNIVYKVTSENINDGNKSEFYESKSANEDPSYYGSINGLWGHIFGIEIGGSDSNYSRGFHIIDGNALTSLYGSMGNNDSSYFLYDEIKKNKYIEIGQEFPFFSRRHRIIKFNDSQYMTTILDEVMSVTKFTGTESIRTPWGNKEAIIFETDYNGTRIMLDTDPQTKEIKQSSFEKQKFGFTKVYLVKGLGIYLSYEGSINPIWSADSYLDQQILNERFPAFLHTTEFDSTSLTLNVEDFTPITDEFLRINMLNGWTWNRSLPWVYNHDTGSWFYYHFSENNLHAYDALNQKWFTFDSRTNAWSGL
jgi:hypothetical protein